MKRYSLIGSIALATLAIVMAYGPRDVLVYAQDTKVASVPAEKETPNYVNNVRPFLVKYCYECHSDLKKKPSAGLNFEKYKDDEALQRDRKMWEEVVNKVKSGEMPPEEKARPPQEATTAAVTDIQAILANVDCGRPQNVGRVTIVRLNKAQYNNTVRDLMGVDFKPAADFPLDDVGAGFDNIGDVLTISPVLLERYITATEQILDAAIVITEVSKVSKNKAVNLKGGISNVAKGQQKGAKQPAPAFPFTLKTATNLQGDAEFEAGEYIIRAELGAEQVGDEPVKATLSVGSNVKKQFEVTVSGTKSQIVEWKTAVNPKDKKVYIRFDNPFTEQIPAKTEEPTKEAKEDMVPNSVKGEDNKSLAKDEPNTGASEPARVPRVRALHVKYIEMEGPFNAPVPPLPEASRKFFVHSDGLEPRDAAREIIARFAMKAYRRPVPPDEVEKILKTYDKFAKPGVRFESSVKMAMYRVLLSPHFLFRVELDPSGATAGNTYLLDEYSLASRMSYFLWSSMPDDELFALAAQNQLRKHLDNQIQRMLKDPKSSAFVENFSSQWLTTRVLNYISPDAKTFPEFDEELRQAMAKETELFFNAMLREDHNIFDFLDANFTFVNERLAKHYGIDGIKGKNFQRVQLPANRRGILMQGSVLVLTSNPDRTSPTKRGKWVLDQLLNMPPPPPPADVPPLEDTQKELKGTVRQVLEQHRKVALCASCHKRMDPIGLALENFDAVGRFRDKENGVEIDSSGVLVDGTSFQGALELVKILKTTKKDEFSRALAEKMLTYATGRGYEYYDKCAVDKVLSELSSNDYRFSVLLTEIIKSDPFQMRTATGIGSKQ